MEKREKHKQERLEKLKETQKQQREEYLDMETLDQSIDKMNEDYNRRVEEQ